MQAIKSGRFMAPVNVAIDLNQGTENTKRCGGYKCNFCMSNFDDKGKEAEIPHAILKRIPNFFKEWGVKSICVAGHHSDPLLYNHSRLVEFLENCCMNGIEIGIVSNGLYYTEEVMKTVISTCKWSGWSINCGTKETYGRITGMNSNGFDSVMNNMIKMGEMATRFNRDHDIGYKFLITNDNYQEILDAIKLASTMRVRHFQIRPGELPPEKAQRIDKKSVELQVVEGIRLYERPHHFEIFGVREKFTPQFTKKPPKRCIASPLGSMWKADGSVVICPDRRWSWDKSDMVLGNFITEGPESIKMKWGGPDHKAMINAVNERLDECIRCTELSWHDIYEHVIENDEMDVTLI